MIDSPLLYYYEHLKTIHSFYIFNYSIFIFCLILFMLSEFEKYNIGKKKTYKIR